MSLRIAYLSDSRLPSQAANSVHVMRMVSALRSIGHETLLIGRSGDATSVDLNEFYGTEPRIDVHALVHAGPPVLRSKVWVTRSRRLLRRTGPWDLLYGRSPTLLLGARRLGAPMVFEMHAISTGRRRRMEQRLLRHEGLLRVVAISQALAADIGRTFEFDTARITVAHDSADLPNAETEPMKLPGRHGAVRVGYLGGFYPGRGLEVLASVAEGAAHVDVVVAGSDHTPDSLASIPNVHSLGRVAPSDVSSFYLALDIGLAPYGRSVSTVGGGDDTSRWMSPLKIVEYLAHGLPVIVSDLPVLHELLDDEVAVFVEPGDHEAFVEAVEMLAADAPRRRSMSSAASERARSNTWRARAEMVLAGLDI